MTSTGMTPLSSADGSSRSAGLSGRRAKRFGLGIDVGGTFTDIVVYDAATGRQASRKELTTHDDPARGVMTGIDRLLRENAVAPADIGRLVHATTLFTNALIERKGATTGLITTAGFRDMLEIGRERKYELYDIRIDKPAPLVPRHWRLEVPERMAVDGSVRIAPRRGGRARGRGAADGGGRHLAPSASCIPTPTRRTSGRPRSCWPSATPASRCRLHRGGARDPRVRARLHHRRQRLHQAAGRELHRALAERIAGRGIAAPLLLMLSNGGLTNIEEAKRTPVQLLESGPAAGALVAAHLGAADGGSTCWPSTWAARPPSSRSSTTASRTVAYGFEAAREKRFVEGSGLPMRISTVELIEIGAGGGSIAHLDDIGLLKVGPTSAGSEPGPAAYGLGGTQPTVTDADFVLGYLNPAYFVGGTHGHRHGRGRGGHAAAGRARGARASPASPGASTTSSTRTWRARRACTSPSTARTPAATRCCAPAAPGPVHAYYVAKKLGLSRLIAPRGAGVASALGLLIAPARVDRVATVAREMDQVVWPELEATFARLEADARAVLAATLPDGAAPAIARLADIRYVGQASELVVPLPAGPYTAASRGALMQAFEASYVAAFTRTPPTTQVEIINVRVSASIEIGSTPRAAPLRVPQRRGLRRAGRGSWRLHAARVSDAGGPDQGHPPRLLPRVPRVPPHHRLRPLRAPARGRLRRPRHRRGARVDPRHRPRRPLRGRRQRQHHRQHRVSKIACRPTGCPPPELA